MTTPSVPGGSMHSVGLTGNAASGKSTVAGLFARLGATVISADALVREVQQPGSDVLRAIARRFGTDVIGTDGALDRDVLRGRVMAHPDERAALEAIVHPAVQRLRAARVASARAEGVRIVVHEIPLLFEATDPDDFDTIVVVDADASVRRHRLKALRGLSSEEADRLLTAQTPVGPKRERADFVIVNYGSPDDLAEAAQAVWNAILDRAGKPVDMP